MALAGIALGVIAQRFLAKGIRRAPLHDGLMLYGMAAFLFVYAFRRRAADLCRPERAESRPLRRWALIPLSLSLSASLSSLYLFGGETHLNLAWTLHLASVALFIAAMHILSDKRQGRGGKRPAVPHLLLAACLLIGAFMRLYKFNSIPYGTWYDEADNGLWAKRILNDPNFRPIYVESTNLPAHFLYLVALSFRLLGVSTQSIRAVSVAFGLATVVAAYLLGRELFNEHLSLVLAFLLAVSRWDINWSRIGMHGVTTPFFELLTLYFLLRGLRTGRLADFAWSGLSLGFGLCFYAAFRLFPIVIALFLSYWVWRERSWDLGFGSLGFNLLIFALAVLVAVAPVAQYAYQHPKIFWSRTRQTSIFRDKSVPSVWEGLKLNLEKHLLMFNYQGDRNGRHNLPGKPMLDFTTSVLFALGLAYSLYRIGSPRYFLLAAWWAVMLCGGILSLAFEAPQSLRSIGSLPAAYALACVPLELLGSEWRKECRAPHLLRAICCVLLLYIGWSNYDTYFNKQARDFAVWNAFSTAETRLAYEIKRLKDEYDLYFAPVLSNQLTTRFLAPEFKDYKPFDAATVFPLRGTAKKGVALFIDPNSYAVRMLAKRYYPGVKVEEFKHPYGGPTVLYTYLFDREDIEGAQGLPGTYRHGREVMRRRDKRVDFDWGKRAPLPFPFEVQWEGALLAPTYGSYGFELVGGGEVWLDGRHLRDKAVLLAEGLHALRIHSWVEGPGKTRLLWRPPGEEGLTVVPEDALYAPPVTANGLLAHYFPNDGWRGPPAFVRVEPLVSYYFHFIPLPRPYTVKWEGYLDIPTSGRYRLGTECLSASWLYIDGKLLVENTRPNCYREGEIELTAGRHRIELRFLDAGNHSHIYLYWTPPGDGRRIVPPERLLPP